MNLLTLGDSFTYGEELDVPAHDCWPQQLANLLGASNLTNLGLPSNSNPAMCRQLIEYFSHDYNYTPDLVVIGWSSPGRMEFSDLAGSFSLWPGYSGRLFRHQQPWREELLNYLNQYHNSEYLFGQFLNQVVFVQSFLKIRSIPYIMLNTVGNEFYKNTCLSKFGHYKNILDLEHYIGWPGDGMVEWTYGCNKGPNGHFLEDGHKKVAEKIYEHIELNVTYFRNQRRVP